MFDVFLKKNYEPETDDEWADFGDHNISGF